MRFSLLSFLLASVCGLAAPIAQPQPSERATVFVQNSAYQTAGRYNQEVFGNFRFIVLRGGVEVPVVRVRGLTGRVGLAVDAARYQTAPGSFFDIDSKLQLRFIDLYARADVGGVSATLGSQISMSCETGSEDPFDTFNSRIFVGDCQGAFWGRLEGAKELSDDIRLTGSIGAALTLPVTQEEQEFSRPDVFTASIGGEREAYPGLFLGARLIGVYRTELSMGESSGIQAPTGVVEPSSYLISLAPYIEVAPADWPVVLRLALEAPGVASSEHLQYGITLTGKNDFKVWVPVTWSMRVRI